MSILLVGFSLVLETSTILRSDQKNHQAARVADQFFSVVSMQTRLLRKTSEVVSVWYRLMYIRKQ